MKMKKIVKYFKPIVFSGILLLSVGCTDSGEQGAGVTESESVQNIRGFFQEKFNGPEDELVEIWNGLNPSEEEKYKKNAKKLDEYVKENLKPYFSNKVYEQAPAVSEYEHLRTAHSNGYDLNVEDIKIEESENTQNSYNFNVEIVKDGSDEDKTINLRGVINTNENGKIVRIHYHNRSELLNALIK